MTLSLHPSPDGQWCAVRRGKQTAWYALGPTAGVEPLAEPAARVELPDPASELLLIGPPTQAITVTRSGDTTSLQLLSMPKLERIAALSLAGRWIAAAVTGSRAALLAEDARTCTVVRAAGKSLVAQVIDPGSGLIDLVLGMERQQLAVATTKKIEVWDAVSARPLTRLQLQLPPPPRTVGSAAGHWWILRAEQILLVRLSDGRPFLHNLGASIRAVVSHPASPWLVVVTSRGLVRISCYAHAMAELDAPSAEAYAIAPAGDEAVLIGASGFAQAPWVLRLSASAAATGVPRVTTGVVVTTGQVDALPVAVVGRKEPLPAGPAGSGAAGTAAATSRAGADDGRGEAEAASSAAARMQALRERAAEQDAQRRAEETGGQGEPLLSETRTSAADLTDAAATNAEAGRSGESSGSRTQDAAPGLQDSFDSPDERATPTDRGTRGRRRSSLGHEAAEEERPAAATDGRDGASEDGEPIGSAGGMASSLQEERPAPGASSPASIAASPDKANAPAEEEITRKAAVPSWALRRAAAPGAQASGSGGPAGPGGSAMARPGAWPPASARPPGASPSGRAPADAAETPGPAGQPTAAPPNAAAMQQAAPEAATPAAGQAARATGARPGAPSWFAGAAARAAQQRASTAATASAAAPGAANPGASSPAATSSPAASSSAASSSAVSTNASAAGAAGSAAAPASPSVPAWAATPRGSAAAPASAPASVTSGAAEAPVSTKASAASPAPVGGAGAASSREVAAQPSWFDASTPASPPAHPPASSRDPTQAPSEAPSFGPAERIAFSGGPRPVPSWASTEPLPRSTLAPPPSAPLEAAPPAPHFVPSSSSTAAGSGLPPYAPPSSPSPATPAGRPSPIAPPARASSSNARAPGPTIARTWRAELTHYGLKMIEGGANTGTPPIVSGNELSILARRLNLPEEARLASTILYAAWLAGQPFVAMDQLAALLGEHGWQEALGAGALGQLGLLRHRDGGVALRRSVADALDGRPWGAIRVAGEADAVPVPLPGRLGRISVSAWPVWQAYLGKVALVTGKLRRALVEARLAELVAVTFEPLTAYPSPWPTGTNLLVVTDAIGGLTELLPELDAPPAR